MERMLRLTLKWMMMAVAVIFVSGSSSISIASVGKEHNKEEHARLCNLLMAAVNKWEEVKTRESTDPLKRALGKTLFGNENGGEMGDLKGGLPKDYEKVEGELSLRLTWCGLPQESATGKKKPRWPGHSAPHDLLCLCTTGQDGYPFNEVGSDSGTATMLCGKPKEALGGGSDGWDSKHRGGGAAHGKDQMTATWVNVTQKCLGGNGERKDLNEALGDLFWKLGKKDPRGGHTERYQLGEGQSGDDYPCSGNEKICVMYYNSTEHKHPMPWWTELQDAIKKDDELHPKKKSEEKRSNKENAQKQRKTQNQENSQPQQEPRTAALRSTTPSTEEPEQANPENISSPTATLEEANGTLIITPCIWFLGVLLLI